MAHVVNASAPQWSVFVHHLDGGDVILHIGATPGVVGRDLGGLVLSADEAGQVAALLLEAGSHLEYVLTEVGSERKRQNLLRDQGRFKYTPAEVPLVRGAVMLTEEVGEVARAALAVSGYVQEELTLADLRGELVQVAAVAVAMIEGIDAGTAGVEPS